MDNYINFTSSPKQGKFKTEMDKQSFMRYIKLCDLLTDQDSTQIEAFGEVNGSGNNVGRQNPLENQSKFIKGRSQTIPKPKSHKPKPQHSGSSNATTQNVSIPETFKRLDLENGVQLNGQSSRESPFPTNNSQAGPTKRKKAKVNLGGENLLRHNGAKDIVREAIKIAWASGSAPGPGNANPWHSNLDGKMFWL